MVQGDMESKNRRGENRVMWYMAVTWYSRSGRRRTDAVSTGSRDTRVTWYRDEGEQEQKQ